jgi:hypothetical protein
VSNQARRKIYARMSSHERIEGRLASMNREFANTDEGKSV